MTQDNNILERVFHIRERGSTVKTELLAGLTTFMTMAYVIFVNPSVLAEAGIPMEAAIAATVYASIFGTLLMGLWVNFPVAMAPAMGVNVFFTYYVCKTLGLHWSVALGTVFLSGVIFLLLTITRLREKLIDSIPLNLKLAIVVGIGTFIALIGLKNGGIVVDHPNTLVTLGSLSNPEPLLCCFGLLLTVSLMIRGVQGAMILGVLATTALAMITGVAPLPKGLHSFVSLDLPSMGEVFMGLDIIGAMHYSVLSVVVTFTIVSLFDNMGTLIGLSKKAGFMREDGHIDNLGKALTADSLGTVASSLVGTSTIACYVESASGISQGGRTGLTAVTVAALFALSLLFAPLIGLIPACATAPALIIVGSLMMADVVHINFSDLTEGFPAFLTIVMMPFTYSIANGIGFAFVSYPLVKLLTGKLPPGQAAHGQRARGECLYLDHSHTLCRELRARGLDWADNTLFQKREKSATSCTKGCCRLLFCAQG